MTGTLQLLNRDKTTYKWDTLDTTSVARTEAAFTSIVSQGGTVLADGVRQETFDPAIEEQYALNPFAGG